MKASSHSSSKPNTVRFLVGCFTEQLSFLMDDLCDSPAPSGLSLWEMDYSKIGSKTGECFAKQTECIRSIKSPSTVHNINNTLVICGREIIPSDGSDGLSGKNSDELNVMRLVKNTFEDNSNILQWTERATLPQSWAACRLHSRVIDKHTHLLFTANYHSSNICVYRIIDGGRSIDYLTTLQSDIQPSRVNISRQMHPHVHDVATHPRNPRLLFANHLGSDAIVRFQLGTDLFSKGETTNTYSDYLALGPGCGPRSIVFHPKLDLVYISCELSCEIKVVACSMRGSDEMKLLQTVDILPDGYKITAMDTAGTVVIDARGESVFASIRGTNTLFSARLDPVSGLIKEDTRFTVNSNGRTPRFITIDPSDCYLMVANHDGEISNISMFEIRRDNDQTGLQLVDYVNVGCPTWIEFLDENPGSTQIRSRL